MPDHTTIASGLETAPTPLDDAGKMAGEASVRVTSEAPATKPNAAEVVVEHLFAQSDAKIPGIAYAVAYHLAEEFIGGDIIDVYHFNNNSVAFSVSDISGKGARAAIHAASIKYGIGIFDDRHQLFTQEVVTISSGTLLVGTTDGITEARSPSGELFGMERFVDLILTNRQADLKVLIDRIIKEALAFSESRVRDDPRDPRGPFFVAALS